MTTWDWGMVAIASINIGLDLVLVFCFLAAAGTARRLRRQMAEQQRIIRQYEQLVLTLRPILTEAGIELVERQDANGSVIIRGRQRYRRWIPFVDVPVGKQAN